MTDKELKKLSRLELLELLLTESRENERLKEELEQAKKENSIEKSAQQLSETSVQFEDTLRKMDSLITALSETRVTGIPVVEAPPPAFLENWETDIRNTADANKPIDQVIYRNLMQFFTNNEYCLVVLPDTLRKAVKKRIRETKDTLAPKADQ
ncbi:MAG: hypothetical protein IIW48_11515 [Clostridia bacterium]|nr:hypothetical protein [Clostridia bacterium]